MSGGIILALGILGQHGYECFKKQYYIQMAGSVAAAIAVAVFVYQHWSCSCL